MSLSRFAPTSMQSQSSRSRDYQFLECFWWNYSRAGVRSFLVSFPLPMLQKKTWRERAIVLRSWQSSDWALILQIVGTIYWIYTCSREEISQSLERYDSSQFSSFMCTVFLQGSRVVLKLYSSVQVSLTAISCNRLLSALLLFTAFYTFLFLWGSNYCDFCFVKVDLSSRPQELIILQYQLVSYVYLRLRSRYSFSFSSSIFLYLLAYIFALPSSLWCSTMLMPLFLSSLTTVSLQFSSSSGGVILVLQLYNCFSCFCRPSMSLTFFATYSSQCATRADTLQSWADEGFRSIFFLITSAI